MSNISNLFENLMTYNETQKQNNRKKRIDESDSTLVNLTVELPNDAEELTPEDVKVDVGVMSVDTSDVEETEEVDGADADETSEGDETDTDVPAEETEESNEDETEEQKDDEKDTNESLKLKRESILKKRLEAKGMYEAANEDTKLDIAIDKFFDHNVKKWEYTDDKKDKVNLYFKDGSEDEAYPVRRFFESANEDTKIDIALDKMFDRSVKKWEYSNDKKDKINITFKDGSVDEDYPISRLFESSDVETAKKNIRRRVNNIEENVLDKIEEKKTNNFKDVVKQELNSLVGTSTIKDTGFSFESDFIFDDKKTAHNAMSKNGWATGKDNSYFKKIDKYRYEAQLSFNEDEKWNISILYSEKNVKKESSVQLDTKSFNNLITQFITENYKNIKKAVITKATLENCSLTLSGKIIDMNGKTESIVLTNKGFDPIKLENKKFIMDFKDVSNTFNIVKESVQRPFVFTATLQNGILKFENLKYSFKTKVNESKVADLHGKCVLKENK